jgi:hypothetical protein
MFACSIEVAHHQDAGSGTLQPGSGPPWSTLRKRVSLPLSENITSHEVDPAQLQDRPLETPGLAGIAQLYPELCSLLWPAKPFL